MDYLKRAIELSKQAKCSRRKVGAVLVPTSGQPIFGANGSVVGDCRKGDCLRCQDESLGLRYDLCQCAHAEEVVIVKALRGGVDLSGACLYVSLQPCFPCVRLAILSGVKHIIYAESVYFPEEFQDEYYKVLKGANVVCQSKEEFDAAEETIEDLAYRRQRNFLLKNKKHQWEKHDLLVETEEELSDAWNYISAEKELARSDDSTQYDEVLSELEKVFEKVKGLRRQQSDGNNF